jgi:hypothetical protein
MVQADSGTDEAMEKSPEQCVWCNGNGTVYDVSNLKMIVCPLCGPLRTHGDREVEEKTTGEE